jgi:hypothetical protein
VAQGIDPEFKPQHWGKKERKKKVLKEETFILDHSFRCLFQSMVSQLYGFWAVVKPRIH